MRIDMLTSIWTKDNLIMQLYDYSYLKNDITAQARVPARQMKTKVAMMTAATARMKSVRV